MRFYGKCFSLMPNSWLLKVGKERWTWQLTINRAYLMDLLVQICAISQQHFFFRWNYSMQMIIFSTLVLVRNQKWNCKKVGPNVKVISRFLQQDEWCFLWTRTRPFENTACWNSMLDQTEQSYNDPCRLLSCSLCIRGQTHSDAAENFHPLCRACNMCQWHWVWEVFSIYFFELKSRVWV